MTQTGGTLRRGKHTKVRPVRWIFGFLALAALGAIAWNLKLQETADVIVFRSSQCDCCNLWIAHLRQHGLKVYVVTHEHLELVRARFRVPDRLAACHTARLGRYTIEGHVPAPDIVRLLRDRPPIAGLAVPGMPIGSPGMERGDRHDPYAVLAFDKQGNTRLFEQH
jgi:hypothetical protein